MKIKKTFINLILIVSILIIIFWVIIEIYEENSIQEEYNIQKLSLYEENEIDKNKIKEYPKPEITSEYKGYDVCAELEIPAINLKTKVLKNYSVNALNVSVTKFWGVDPNCIGNCSIAGHNFKNENMFRNLKKLKLGDKLFVADKEIGKVEYEVFYIDKVLPEDVSCLDAITKNEREVTLITCTNDSKKRIIIKAKEV